MYKELLEPREATQIEGESRQSCAEPKAPRPALRVIRLAHMDGEDDLSSAVAIASAAMTDEGFQLNGGDADAKETLAYMSQKGRPLAWANGQKVTLNQMKKVLRDARKRVELELDTPADEPPRQPTQRAIEANGGIMLENPFDTAAVECKVTGRGLNEAAVRHTSEFVIEAHDGRGSRKITGGDAFFVAIRGASRVRARITDNNDGTYKVEWKPPQSGTYSIAVSFFGNPLPGSPFTLTASTPVPFAQNCIAKGDALNNAIARSTQSFQVSFKDKLGNVSYWSIANLPLLSTSRIALLTCFSCRA